MLTLLLPSAIARLRRPPRSLIKRSNLLTHTSAGPPSVRVWPARELSDSVAPWSMASFSSLFVLPSASVSRSFPVVLPRSRPCDRTLRVARPRASGRDRATGRKPGAGGRVWTRRTAARCACNVLVAGSGSLFSRVSLVQSARSVCAPWPPCFAHPTRRVELAATLYVGLVDFARTSSCHLVAIARCR
jgi:hypothetical protein